MIRDKQSKEKSTPICLHHQRAWSEIHNGDHKEYFYKNLQGIIIFKCYLLCLKKKKLQLESLKEKKKQQELHLASVLSYLGTLYSC